MPCSSSGVFPTSYATTSDSFCQYLRPSRSSLAAFLRIGRLLPIPVTNSMLHIWGFRIATPASSTQILISVIYCYLISHSKSYWHKTSCSHWCQLAPPPLTSLCLDQGGGVGWGGSGAHLCAGCGGGVLTPTSCALLPSVSLMPGGGVEGQLPLGPPDTGEKVGHQRTN